MIQNNLLSKPKHKTIINAGSKSPMGLRFKGHEVCTRISRYERAGKSIIKVLEEGKELDFDDDEEFRNFWDYMREKVKGIA